MGRKACILLRAYGDHAELILLSRYSKNRLHIFLLSANCMFNEVTYNGENHFVKNENNSKFVGMKEDRKAFRGLRVS